MQSQTSRRNDSTPPPIRLAMASVNTGQNTPVAGAVTPLLLTAPEAAKVLRIGRRKLWELTKSGAIRAIHLGRSVRYDPRELQSWVDRISGRAQNAAPARDAGE